MIYICIPTHNEQQTVGVVLWKLRQVLTEYPRDYQLLVADDASTDKTQDVLEPYTRVLPLTVIRSDSRQGYAASLEMLLREAARRSEYPKRDVVVTLQADFSEEPDDVVALLKRLEAGADVAVGRKVAAAKPRFARRFARRLSEFFTRGQQWPEGLTEPFDSYRAYRLYAVKQAIDERQGRRLLRYDSWAAHAELLRAVLPHARRVEVVEVEDRSDRKQRPSRERPFAAALQVRSMMREVEPGDLVPVAELDRLAATASRTRDRTAANGNGRRPQNTSGSATRDARARERGRGAARGEGRRDETRGRSAGESRGSGESRGGRTDGRRSAGGDSRPPREGRPRGERKEGGEERSPRPPRPPRPPRQRETPVSAPQGAAPAAEGELELTHLAPPADAAEAGVEGGAATDDAPRKRRRRRRGRGGSKRTAAETAEAGPESEAENGGADAGPEDEAGGGDPQDGERKRRRRGGRRGGRGRRKRQPGEAAAEGEVPNGNPSDGVEPMAGANAAPPPESRADEE